MRDIDCRIDASLLQEYGITLTQFALEEPADVYDHPKVVVLSIRDDALTVNYQVLTGPFIVNVKMLNLENKMFDHLTKRINNGAFGSIIPLSDEGGKFVAKRIKFDESTLMAKAKGAAWKVRTRF